MDDDEAGVVILLLPDIHHGHGIGVEAVGQQLERVGPSPGDVGAGQGGPGVRGNDEPVLLVLVVFVDGPSHRCGKEPSVDRCVQDVGQFSQVGQVQHDHGIPYRILRGEDDLLLGPGSVGAPCPGTSFGIGGGHVRGVGGEHEEAQVVRVGVAWRHPK